MDKETSAQTFDLDALRAGDRADFAHLVDVNYELVYRLASKMLGNTQDAEDVLQETFIKAYRHLSNFDGRASLSTWLYRIATNEALMVLRRNQPHSLSIDTSLETEEGEIEPVQIKDWCCLPEEEMMSTEARLYLDKAITELPPATRAVFVLRDIQGLSTRETGQILGITEGAVKTRLSRARLRLRELLTDYYGERLEEGN